MLASNSYASSTVVKQHFKYDKEEEGWVGASSNVFGVYTGLDT